jgi:hypothetical protein
MIAKTDKGKAIRKYYVKLENIHNKIIKEEIENQKLHVYFNNLNEIQLKLGICSKTILNSINDKTLYAGSLWEYA